MDNEQDRQRNLLDATDCLEAVGVFRVWKNALFILILLCLLLLQAAFWLVETGYVTKDKNSEGQPQSATAEKVQQTSNIKIQAEDEAQKIEQAAKQIIADTNQAAVDKPKLKKINVTNLIKLDHLTQLTRILNFVLIPAAALYCLTMLFSLKISLLGRLGGVNHISRAFFISLAMVILLLPWQILFPGVIKGAIYSPEELINSHATAKHADIFGLTFYYLRFVGYCAR